MFEYSPTSQRLLTIGALALTLTGGHLLAQANASAQAAATPQVASANGITVINIQSQAASVDFVHAKPKTLPINPFATDATRALLQSLAATPALGPSGFSAGGAGTGKTSSVSVGVPDASSDSLASNDFTSQDFGTSNHPFSTARADLFSANTNTQFPYRAAGKLFFTEPGGTYMCSASLIKRGVVVTAAHCVANFGEKQFYTGWQFIPGYRNGVAPYGVWTVKQAFVPTSYYNGTDSCAVSGVVCADDVAVLILNTQSNAYAGSSTGWLGYWYGGGFSGNGLIQITQLGYPAGLDNALYMERNDSYGYVSSGNSNNTMIGSNMNGGSSGGPWIVNFGLPYALTGETNGSGYSFTNAVVGVTSWGYTSNGPKEMGAAPFTSSNIQTLVNSACSSTPAACS